jgi:hypothetical protein
LAVLVESGSVLARIREAVLRWLRHRRGYRRRIARAAWDLRERYGEAAYRIARNSARAPTGAERRFWLDVAWKIRRAGAPRRGPLEV